MRSKNYLWLLVFFLGACAPTSQAPSISNDLAAKEAKLQKEIAVKESMKHASRLLNVARPILISNTALCGERIGAYVGAQTETSSEISSEYREAFADLYGVGEWPTVTNIVSKSPAADKLKVGDMITHLEDEALPKGKRGHKNLVKALAENDEAQSFTVTVDRKGVSRDITIQPQLACDFGVALQPGDIVNAFADGDNIYVTQGMMRFAEKDTELALVLGHELAHNSRRHVRAKTGNAVLGGVLGAVVTVATGIDFTDLGMQIGASAHSQGFEYEADYVGLYHTARAGYNISAAPNFWRRMGASNPAAIHLAGSSHPSTAKRFLALESAVKEINAKKASGKSLVPEEKTQEELYPKEEKGLND